MQVAHRIDTGTGGIDGLRHRPGIKPGSDKGGYIQPQRPIADTAKSQRNLEAAIFLVERDLGSRRDKGKVRTARADLKETDADARVDQTGNRIALMHSP